MHLAIPKVAPLVNRLPPIIFILPSVPHDIPANCAEFVLIVPPVIITSLLSPPNAEAAHL